MTAPQRLLLTALVLILPLLVLGGIILQNEIGIGQAQVWRVKITGYDPRDMLIGHYLSFRFNWNLQSSINACPTGKNCCLCLEKQNDSNVPRSSLLSCTATAQCLNTIALPDNAHCGTGGQNCVNNEDIFNPLGVQRYYIPETATALSRFLTNTKYDVTLDLQISPSGQHRLGKLYIDGTEWQDYLVQHPEAETPQRAQSHSHTWRLKLIEPRLYGAYLVFKLNWGTAISHDSCPDTKACCALCLTEQSGATTPVISYKTCGVEQCTENLIFHDPASLNHTDTGFDPDGPQRYPLNQDETRQVGTLLREASHDLAIDVKTNGWGGPPLLGELIIDGVPWHVWVSQPAKHDVP